MSELLPLEELLPREEESFEDEPDDLPDLELADLSDAFLEEEDFAFVDEVFAPASELADLSELLLLLLPAPPDEEGELELAPSVLLLLLLPKLLPLEDPLGLLDDASPD